jgi:hypothetical protein
MQRLARMLELGGIALLLIGVLLFHVILLGDILWFNKAWYAAVVIILGAAASVAGSLLVARWRSMALSLLSLAVLCSLVDSVRDWPVTTTRIVGLSYGWPLRWCCLTVSQQLSVLPEKALSGETVAVLPHTTRIVVESFSWAGLLSTLALSALVFTLLAFIGYSLRIGYRKWKRVVVDQVAIPRIENNGTVKGPESVDTAGPGR